MTKRKWRFSYPHLVALGFALVILLGAFLLSLPIASNSGTRTPFLSCLFTATSATCVTGLIVVDTMLHWSVFGRAVILCLIQIGGLGFMTLMTTFSMAFHRHVSLHERAWLRDNFNVPHIGHVMHLLRRILIGTVAVECIGATVVATRLVPKFGFWNGLGRSVFLSVSAFCNAGFDPFGDQGAYSSLVTFANDGVLIVTVALLILMGGIGFLVWDDVLIHKWHFRKYRLHSKLVVSLTVGITVIGTVIFFLLERQHTGTDLPISQQILNAFFASVTPRTAGFNSVDINEMHPVAGALTTLLMFIGGSPGSTAGGVKTTTVAVLVICCISNLFNKSGFNLFRRRLPAEIVVQAVCVTGFQMMLVMLGIFLISANQPMLSLSEVVFESFSAIGTVGLSTGITRELSTFSRLVIMALMYSGRLGSLTFAMIFVQKSKKELLLFPEETVSIG